ncbi:unnamed protein product [Rotaria sp. Silwood1]|nr:unnamed protein product [Rotaria sp. Silwood1]
MSHNHLDEETQGNGIFNNDHTNRHRNSNNLNLKPIAVIDHIKTKVRRRRASNNISTEILDSPKNNNNNNKNINGNRNIKQTTQEHHRSEPRLAVRSQMIDLSQTLPNRHLDNIYDKKNNSENNLLIAKHGNRTNVSDHIDKDENTNETVQSGIDQIEVDIDNNQNQTRAKSLPEPPIEFNTKKRHRTGRCKNFQIRDEEFNNIFNDLPANEQLIVAYPCAWRKEILMHGQMFLSVNYICFYTCFLKWKESLCIAYKDIVNIKREKSTKVLPNAIKLRTKNREQYVFASYIPRERIFFIVSRLWQNSLLEQPLNYEQLRTSIFTDQFNIDESSEDSEGSIEGEHNHEHPVKRYLHSESSPPIVSNHSKNISSTPMISEQEMDSSLPNEQETNYASTCPCETHLSKTFAERVFSYDVDMLFELIFGDNSFTHDYHESQKLLEYTIGEWYINNETGKRERQVTYKTITQSILGTNMLTCNEKQIIEAEKSHSIYVVRTDVYNEGMKYTDAFFVSTQFCILQRDIEHSSLRISAEINYIKNVNTIAKTFIEKNANASIEGGVNNLKDEIILNEDIITGKNLLFNMTLCFGIFLLILHTYLCYKLHSIDQALYSPNFTCLNQCKEACLGHLVHQ